MTSQHLDHEQRLEQLRYLMGHHRMFLQLLWCSLPPALQFCPFVADYKLDVCFYSFDIFIQKNAEATFLLTNAVPPEIPQTAAVPPSQDIDVSVGAAAGVLVAVTWRPAALRELSPQRWPVLIHRSIVPSDQTFS